MITKDKKGLLPPIGERSYLSNQQESKYQPLEIIPDKKPAQNLDDTKLFKIYKDPLMQQESSRPQEDYTPPSQERKAESLIKLQPIEVRGKFKSPRIKFKNMSPHSELQPNELDPINLKLPAITKDLPDF